MSTQTLKEIFHLIAEAKSVQSNEMAKEKEEILKAIFSGQPMTEKPIQESFEHFSLQNDHLSKMISKYEMKRCFIEMGGDTQPHIEDIFNFASKDDDQGVPMQVIKHAGLLRDELDEKIAQNQLNEADAVIAARMSAGCGRVIDLAGKIQTLSLSLQ